jgi:hypothetical protein
MSESSLVGVYGSARRPDRPPVHPRPAGMTDETVAALGSLSAALEVAEHARGHLYAFHRMSGSADLALQDAVRELRAAGHPDLAEDIEGALVGRDVIDGKWTFQLVEDYDAGYLTVFRAAEAQARMVCGDAAPHIYEAEMKAREQSG